MDYEKDLISLHQQLVERFGKGKKHWDEYSYVEFNSANCIFWNGCDYLQVRTESAKPVVYKGEYRRGGTDNDPEYPIRVLLKGSRATAVANVCDRIIEGVKGVLDGKVYVYKCL